MALLSSAAPAPRSRSLAWVGLIGSGIVMLWMIPGIVCALQVYVNRVVGGGAAYAWGSIWWYALPPWLARVPTTLLILWLAHRVRLDGAHRVRGLVIHMVMALVQALVHLGFYAYWLDVAAPYDVPEMAWWDRTIELFGGAWLHFAVLAYWGTVGAYYAFDYSRKLRDRALQASRLEARLAEAQLHALQMQLHPHFLFNTLNAISTLVLQQETDQAGRMINHLSDFLRMTLATRGEQEVALEDELAFTEQYIAIEACRLQDRLQVYIDIDPVARLARVPSLLLQPLVENAIRYGIAPREEGGRLVLRARREGDRLVLQVGDDGPGVPAGADPVEGIGLANTRARLEQRYGSAHHFALDTSPLGGVRVTVAIPFQMGGSHGDGSLHPSASLVEPHLLGT